TTPNPTSAVDSATRKRSASVARGDRSAGTTMAFSRQPPRSTTLATSVMACLRPRHEQPDGVRVGLIRSEGANDLATVHDNEPIAELEQLVEVLRHQQDGGTGVAACAQHGP